MNIVLLSAEYWPTPGGVGDYTAQLGAELALTGHAVTVWTIQSGQLVALDPTARHHVVEAYGPARWDWSCWRAVIQALQQIQPDVLHIQYQTGAYGMHPAINLLPWRIRRLAKRPRLVVTAHDLLLPYLFPKATLVRHWVTHRLLEDCDAAIVTNPDDLAALVGPPGAVTNTAAETTARFTGELKTSPLLIPIGSNIAVQPPEDYDRMAWRANLGVQPEELLIAYFGLISPTKGLDGLLDAMLLLPAGFRLLIIGGEAPAPQDRAYAAALRARIATPELQERVIITGHCAEAQVSAHLLAADMAALPFADGASFRRGSLLAALTHGLAIVTTSPQTPVNTNSVVPVLTDGVHVRCIPIGDSPALAAALQALAADPPLRVRLGQSAHALASLFSWPTIAAQHQDLYQHLLRSS